MLIVHLKWCNGVVMTCHVREASSKVTLKLSVLSNYIFICNSVDSNAIWNRNSLHCWRGFVSVKIFKGLIMIRKQLGSSFQVSALFLNSLKTGNFLHHIMLCIIHCLRYISYMRVSCTPIFMQIGCHYTDWYVILFLILAVMVDVGPGSHGTENLTC